MIPGGPDDLLMLALTVWGEARSESDVGKLAVAWVVMNRARAEGKPLSWTVLRPWQFSFWNTDDPSRPAIGGIETDSATWRSCYKAACAAYFALLPDPTNGATHYLNVDVTRQIRGGTLPAWAADPSNVSKVNPALVVAIIERHTFLKL